VTSSRDSTICRHHSEVPTSHNQPSFVFGLPAAYIRNTSFQHSAVHLQNPARCAPAAPTERSRLVVSEIEPSPSFHPTGKPTSYSVVRFYRSPSFGFRLKFFAWRSAGGGFCATYARQAPGPAHRISLGGAVMFASLHSANIPAFSASLTGTPSFRPLHGLLPQSAFRTAHNLNQNIHSYLIPVSVQIVPGWPLSDRSAQIVGRRSKRR